MVIVLSTFGTSLKKEGDCFVILTEGKEKKIAACDVHSIQISRGIIVTSDAVMLAIEKEVELLFVDNIGMPQGRIWSHRYGSISTIRKGQLAFTHSEEALIWIKEELNKKIINQQSVLQLLPILGEKTYKSRIVKAVARLEDYRKKINAVKGDSVKEAALRLRGIEGTASRIYFSEIQSMLPSELSFNTRSQHPAKDVVNALLNYGYGILYGKIEGALIKAGIDPYIGILHRDMYGRPVLVYDVIEQYRIWVDYVVLKILMQIKIDESYFSVDEDGSVWLESLGKRVLIQSFNDYMEEIITKDGIQRSRNTMIQMYANGLADKFQKYNN